MNFHEEKMPPVPARRNIPPRPIPVVGIPAAPRGDRGKLPSLLKTIEHLQPLLKYKKTIPFPHPPSSHSFLVFSVHIPQFEKNPKIPFSPWMSCSLEKPLLSALFRG
ncbi:hypothetical protein SLA2020_093250 [Shorea laevis]